MQDIRHASIIGVGSYLPQRRLTNDDLAQMVDTSDEWIITRTGIKERRLAAPDEATSDLATRAARKAIDNSGVSPEDIDLLIVGTSSPDMIFPSTACLTQAKLGLTCAAYDVSAACSSFIFALHSGTVAIESGRARTVLVVGADALTRHVDFQDRATCVLFGDGAGAVVLQASETAGILGIDLGSDGTGADVLQIPAGGSAMPATPENIEQRLNYLKMDGRDVFKFAVRVIPQTTLVALSSSGLTVQDIDWLVPHQANQRILDTVAQRLEIPLSKVVSTIAETGNTSAASIPLALDDLYTAGKLRSGNILALVGFGGGLTWGAAIVRWTKEAR